MSAYDAYLDSVWLDKQGRIWRTVSVIIDPAVVIVPESTEHPEYRRETHVIGSPLLRERFTELRPVAS